MKRAAKVPVIAKPNAGMPFIDEYSFMKDADVYDSIIKLVTCTDEQGKRRQCTIEEIQKECTALPNCAAFNSNGYLKSFIRKGERTGRNETPE